MKDKKVENKQVKLTADNILKNYRAAIVMKDLYCEDKKYKLGSFINIDNIETATTLSDFSFLPDSIYYIESDSAVSDEQYKIICKKAIEEDLIHSITQSIKYNTDTQLVQDYDNLLEKINTISNKIKSRNLIKLLSSRLKDNKNDVNKDFISLQNANTVRDLYSVDSLMTTEFKKPEYLIDKVLVKGSILFIVAKAGRGKTLISTNLALSLTKGQKLFGEFNVNASPKVLYYEIDNNGKQKMFWRIKYIMKGCNYNPDIYKRFTMTHNFYSNDLDKELELVKNYDVVILDSYRRFLNGDENKSEVTNEFFKAFLSKLKDMGKTVIVLLHVKKGNFAEVEDEDLLDMLRGSSDIGSQADFAINITKTPDIEDSTKQIRDFDISIIASKDRDGSIAKQYSIHVTKNDTLEQSAFNFTGYNIVANNSKNDLRDLILNILKVKGRTKTHIIVSEVNQKFKNASFKTVTRKLDELIELDLIKSDMKGWYSLIDYEHKDDSQGRLI